MGSRFEKPGAQASPMAFIGQPLLTLGLQQLPSLFGPHWGPLDGRPEPGSRAGVRGRKPGPRTGRDEGREALPAWKREDYLWPR